MGQFCIVAAHAFKPLIGAASMPTQQLERLAERAGLPGRIIEDTTGYVPLTATESFLNLVHRKLGDPSFLYDSLTLDMYEKNETHAVVGIPLPIGETGKEALQALTDTFNCYITGATFYCQVDGRFLWVERTTSATEWSNEWPVVQYNLSIMLLGVRRVLGRWVRPVALHLPELETNDKLPDELRDIPIYLKKDGFGLAFDVLDVASSGFTLGHTETHPHILMTEPAKLDVQSAISSCLSQFIMSSTTDTLSKRVAKSFGISERSYRRELANFGTNHSKLLADVRLDAAIKLLADETNAVADIAVELGYAHSGDFTRFFKRRVGCSPTEYRHKVKSLEYAL
jgi:AraC-like DNA-binding protein